jgi:hypothetical protein
MLKTGIYVDAENIRLCGGYGMRYDVLVELASVGKSVLLRANSYLAEDRARTKEDPEYRQKLYRYHDVLRQCGFRVIKKYVKHFVDDEGILTTKANADMDLAIDALHQARNLDRVILLTGDGLDIDVTVTPREYPVGQMHTLEGRISRQGNSSMGSEDLIVLQGDQVRILSVTIVPLPPCPADIVPSGGNHVVDIDDLVLVITSWGATGSSPGDANHNGIVNIDDLVAVITSWGPCP